MTPLIKESVLYGLAWVALSAGLYFIDPLLTQKPGVGFGIFALNVAGMIWIAIRERQHRGGYMSYWPAWRVLTTISLIAGAFSLLWTVLLFQVIDPDYQQMLYDTAIEQQLIQMEEQGISDAQIEQSMELMEGMMQFFTSMGGILLMLALGLGFGLLLNMLWALIVRREKPFNEALDGDF